MIVSVIYDIVDLICFNCFSRLLNFIVVVSHEKLLKLIVGIFSGNKRKLIEHHFEEEFSILKAYFTWYLV